MWTRLCLLLLVSAAPVALGGEPECNPGPDPTLPQYIVGYGSLMAEQSKRRTAPNAGTSLPVRVRGFRRGWIVRGSGTGFSTTFLGVRDDPEGEIVAVIYRLFDEAAVARTDARERSYCRQRVPPERMLMLDGSRVPDGEAWIYVNGPDRVAPPSRRFPLVQSYIDIFLGGCLELEDRFELEGFARQCVRTTHGWSRYWVNDRLYPRRPFIHQPKAGRIDRLLKNELPRLFPKIKIE